MMPIVHRTRDSHHDTAKQRREGDPSTSLPCQLALGFRSEIAIVSQKTYPVAALIVQMHLAG